MSSGARRPRRVGARYGTSFGIARTAESANADITAPEAGERSSARRNTCPVADELEAGRRHFAAREWRSAFACLSSTAADADDLERLATAAYLIGRMDEYFQALERAHRGYLDAGQNLAAANCAGWIGLMRMKGGDVGQGSGWIARAGRLVEQHGADCAHVGYLMFPEMFGHEAAGDMAAALQVAADAAEIGRRFSDPDLVALAVQGEGQCLIELGRVAEGLTRLDEAMVAVTAGELSPIVNGLVYCSVITGCRMAYEVGRATEWTAAMSRWCAGQPDMLAFAGECRVHRAEILELLGEWHDAMAEIDGVTPNDPDSDSRAEAHYRRAELHRVQGRSDEAETAYRAANDAGREPQPGLALLRLGHGSVQAATTMVTLALHDAREPARRIALLPAAGEILVAAGDRLGAAAASDELTALSARYGSQLLTALAEQSAGRLALGVADPETALRRLRAAAAIWQGLRAPYELARTRVLLGRTLRELGDVETAELEFDSARTTFVQLNAVVDLAALDELRGRGDAGSGLTARELEVLRLVAAGATNRAIAEQLVLSERTVDRHVSNILAKIGVSSRTAAAAYAIERQLV
jgi:DNA-binding CsgD family transcriptional regulator